MNHSPVPESDLRRFAGLAAPLFQGATAYGYGPRAARNQAGRGLEFLDTRRYEPGDDWRSIDWRQSARSNKLVIRRYQEESAEDWFICIDRSASVAWGDRKWPMTQRLASALAYTLLHAGHRVALVLWSDRVHDVRELGRGAQHFAALLRMLISHRPAAPDSYDSSNLGVCRSIVRRNSNVFVLSDFLNPDGMQPDLRAIRARSASLSAIQILDELEVQASAHTSSALVDIESGETRQIELTADNQRATEAALTAHSVAVQKSCRSLNVRFTTCRTMERWQRVLLDHLRARS